jgi:hypothetical protein
MARIFPGRYTTQIEGDFVVFLIGARVNRLLLPHKWMPVFSAMPKMLKELAQKPELGMMYAYNMVGWRTVSLVQYWRSFEQLHAYAHAKDKDHLPAWTEFNRRVGATGVVGVFHETYMITAGKYEAVYVNMPRFGLGLAGEVVPAVGRMQSAKERIVASGEK